MLYKEWIARAYALIDFQEVTGFRKVEAKKLSSALDSVLSA